MARRCRQHVGLCDLLVGMRTGVTRLAIPSLIGGLVGAILLIKTPTSRFDAIVPWVVPWRRHRNPHARRARLHGVPQHPPHERSQEPGRPLRKCGGGGDVRVQRTCWPVAGAMALGATLGGYGGSQLSQRVPQPRVRQAIIVIGFAKPAKPAPRPAPKGTAALGVTIRGISGVSLSRLPSECERSVHSSRKRGASARSIRSRGSQTGRASRNSSSERSPSTHCQVSLRHAGLYAAKKAGGGKVNIAG